VGSSHSLCPRLEAVAGSLGFSLNRENLLIQLVQAVREKSLERSSELQT
jgi:hypothetical protein